MRSKLIAVVALGLGCTRALPGEATDAEPQPRPMRQCRTATPAPVFVPSCASLPGYQRRLTHDLSAHERELLRAGLRDPHGLLVAEVIGCEVRVLADCWAVGRYDYYTSALDPFQRAELSTVEELWSNLPSFAANDGRDVIIEDVVRGHLVAATAAAPRALELVGSCATATHVMFKATLGAGTVSLASDGTELARTGYPEACAGSSDPDQLALRGCLEPIQLKLLPLDARAPLTEPCLAPTVWNHDYCVDQSVHPPEMCLDPAWCFEPGDDLMFERAPEALSRDELREALAPVACRGERASYHMMIDGPSGRILEVCSEAPEFEVIAERILATRLPTTHQPTERRMLSCFDTVPSSPDE
jgi:hypothetical protein